MALVAVGGRRGQQGPGEGADRQCERSGVIPCESRHTSWVMRLSLRTAEIRSICRAAEGPRFPAQGVPYPRDDTCGGTRRAHSSVPRQSERKPGDRSASPDSKLWASFLASPRELSVHETRTMAEICPQSEMYKRYVPSTWHSAGG